MVMIVLVVIMSVVWLGWYFGSGGDESVWYGDDGSAGGDDECYGDDGSAAWQ